MNIKYKKRLLIISILGLTYSLKAQVNSGSFNNSESKIIYKLIETKKNLNKSHKIEDRYIIQLYSGNMSEANSKIRDFNVHFDIKTRLKYESPDYKVWIGSFRNRIEADRALLKIKEVYPAAFIPKPTRK
ncbi:SPOR domain-containing protein [Zunongwangia sp.]|uniref:SPOR domain-containing protein n=1 Tax=Zunongwangia sp. TaxID=1965325 RepID=UPI003AA80589